MHRLGHRRWRLDLTTGLGLCEQHQRRYGDGESYMFAETTNHLVSSDSTDFEIEKAPVTATGGGGSATYDGDSKTPSDCEVTGTYTGDLDCTNDPTSVGPDAGTYPISPVVTGTGLANFEIDEVEGSYEISKALLTVTADDQTIDFGDSDPTFTFEYDGFVGTDGPSEIDTPPACGVTGAHTQTGSYTITCSGGEDNNYKFSYMPGTLTVIGFTPSGFYQPVGIDHSIYGTTLSPPSPAAATAWNTVRAVPPFP